MTNSIDAKFFILSPDDKSKKRIEIVIEKEICEVYILENLKSVSEVISHFTKSILVVDCASFNSKSELRDYTSDLLNRFYENLINIIIICDTAEEYENEKIMYLRRDQISNDEDILKLIHKMDIEGERKYIRLGHKDSRIAFFRMKLQNKWRTGVIHDLSASGMSCSFDKHHEIFTDENDTIIEICITEKIFQLSGKFLLRRTFKNDNMFVLVFSRKKNMENINSLNSILYHLNRKKVLEKISKLA
jgi:uncharacterized protein YjgD (DUF1641 family)